MIKNFSSSNTYKTSEGKRYTSAQVDRKIREACRAVMQKQAADYGYNFCKVCGINNRHSIIDPSHDESVKSCKENGYVEKAWSEKNITPRCRGCHNKHDKLS